MLIGFYAFRQGVVTACCEEGNEILVLYMAGNFMAQRLPAFQQVLSSMKLRLVYKNSNSQCQGSIYKVLYSFMNGGEYIETVSVVSWSEYLSTDSDIPGSIPGATRYSQKEWVCNGVHSAS
jgi:hypothetical protein